MNKERKEFEKGPEAVAREKEELALLFQNKGLSKGLAEKVAEELSSKEDVPRVHIIEELGINPDELTSPLAAAVASAISFMIGAIVPLIVILAANTPTAQLIAIPIIAGMMMFVIGVVSAKLNRTPVLRPALRVFIGGSLAMGATYLVGYIFGASGA